MSLLKKSAAQIKCQVHPICSMLASRTAALIECQIALPGGWGMVLSHSAADGQNVPPTHPSDLRPADVTRQMFFHPFNQRTWAHLKW